ncbi:hypothetical protein YASMINEVIRUS_194 [Yasminevirus sp. GU-2018]|uniref:Lipoxygenase domain-containing protein n=1 Tax=Yasminevirus sp. GU-2018 TaxID=2420051 RepID=A0A5K0U892_9VIRU|nr:hypothetical protein YASMINEVIRUS_194 [Yasminevirus sp. GU-2018]
MNLSTRLIKTLMLGSIEYHNVYDVRSFYENEDTTKYISTNLSAVIPGVDVNYLTQNNVTFLYNLAGILGASIKSTDNGKRVTEKNMSDIESGYTKYIKFKKISEKFASRLDHLKWLISSGYLAMCIQKNNNNEGEWMIDFSFMEPCEVKPEFHNYGGVLRFDVNPDPTVDVKNKIIIRSITYKGLKQSMTENLDQLDKYINIIIASGFFYTSVMLHALIAHVLVSGGAFKALHDLKNKKSQLSKILHIFTYQSPVNNYKAQHILLKKNGLLRKLFGFTDDGFEEVVRRGYSLLDMGAVTQRITTPSSLSSLPIMTQLSLWLNVIEKFAENVDQYLNKTDSEDKKLFAQKMEGYSFLKDTTFKDIFKTLVFVSTVYHSVVGNIMYYHGDPKYLSVKVYKNDESAQYPTVQEYHMLLVLTVATVYETMPKLLDEFEPYFDESEKDGLYKLFLSFQTDLRGLEKVLSEKDPDDTNIFPSTTECSVSL